MMSQKFFSLNINFFGSTEDQNEVVRLYDSSDIQEELDEIKPAADILEFTYPPESPFFKG